MTHSQFIPIARRELEKLGFVVEEIPSQASSQRKTPDFSVIGKSCAYLIELKVKGDDPAEIERDRKRLETGKVVMKATPTGPRNTLASIIRDGVKQMDDEDRDHAKFHVLWLHSWGRDAELSLGRFRSTLFGCVQTIYPPNIAPMCYYFYDSSFFRLRDTLDAAIVSFDDGLQLCVNSLSPLVSKFRNSELYQSLREYTCDPDKEEIAGRGLIVDSDIDRNKKDLVLDYLKKKYRLPQIAAPTRSC